MPQPKRGSGPWGDAIQYWLKRLNIRQSERARKTGLPANTISRPANGLDCQTRIIARIAKALEVPLEEILVSPARFAAAEARVQLAREIAEDVLRKVDARFTSSRTDNRAAALTAFLDRVSHLDPDSLASYMDQLT